MDRARRALLWIAAILTGGYGAVLLWGFARMVPSLTLWEYGSLGGFSAGFIEELAPFALGVAGNRLVAWTLRGSDGLVHTLHRVHAIALLVLTAAVCAWFIVGLIVIVLIMQSTLAFYAGPVTYSVFFVLRLCAAFLSVAQLPLLSVVLALCALERRPFDSSEPPLAHGTPPLA